MGQEVSSREPEAGEASGCTGVGARDGGLTSLFRPFMWNLRAGLSRKW